MSKHLTKTKLIAAVADATSMSKKDVASCLDALTEVVRTEIASGGAVTLPGLVKISMRDRPARMVRNPSNGEMVQRDADRTVKVAAVKDLKVISAA